MTLNFLNKEVGMFKMIKIHCQIPEKVFIPLVVLSSSLGFRYSRRWCLQALYTALLRKKKVSVTLVSIELVFI